MDHSGKEKEERWSPTAGVVLPWSHMYVHQLQLIREVLTHEDEENTQVTRSAD